MALAGRRQPPHSPATPGRLRRAAPTQGRQIGPAAQGRILDDPTPNKQAHSAAVARLWWASINPDAAPLDTIHCRKAVACATDKLADQNAYGGPRRGHRDRPDAADPGRGVVRPLPGRCGQPRRFHQGQGRADRCGSPSGFSTNFADRAERPKEKATAEGLLQSLAKVGIKVTLEPFPQDLPGRARRTWPRATSAGPPMPPSTPPPSGLQDEAGLTYVFIAHDLSVVRHIFDQVAVMDLGKIVEIADRAALSEHPMHPYTHALLSAVPVPDPTRAHKREQIPLTGDVPSPLDPPPACRFHTWCWKAQDCCQQIEPPLLQLAPGQQVACDVLEERVIV